MQQRAMALVGEAGAAPVSLASQRSLQEDLPEAVAGRDDGDAAAGKKSESQLSKRQQKKQQRSQESLAERQTKRKKAKRDHKQAGRFQTPVAEYSFANGIVCCRWDHSNAVM